VAEARAGLVMTGEQQQDQCDERNNRDERRGRQGGEALVVDVGTGGAASGAAALVDGSGASGAHEVFT
jgi:hypothetical protein